MPGGSPTLSNGIKRDGDTQPRPRGWGQHPGEHRGSNPNPISPKNKPYRAAPPIPSRPTFLAFFSLRLCLALLMLSSPVPSEWVSGAYGDRDRSNGVGVTKIPRVPRDGGFGALKPPPTLYLGLRRPRLRALGLLQLRDGFVVALRLVARPYKKSKKDRVGDASTTPKKTKRPKKTPNLPTLPLWLASPRRGAALSSSRAMAGRCSGAPGQL